MLTVYFVCALLGGVVLTLLTLLSIVGIGDTDVADGGVDLTEGELDALDDAQSPDESSYFFKLLSLRALIAALCFFGLGGGMALSAGAGEVMSLITALGCGIAAMVLVVWLMDLLVSLQQNRTIRLELALGAQGEAYIPIPAKGEGQGKVTVTLAGRSVELNAVSKDAAIPTGASVEIVSIDGEMVTVKPVAARRELEL